MKKKRVVLIGLLIILVVGLIGCFSLMYLSNNYEEVEQVVSLVEEQETLEKDFTSAGYTIENPNVILNPYQISPLTALVIFETEEEVAPRVTIVGKDEHSTFTHEFESSTIHYLPIYGLYAGRENEIIIEYGDVSKPITIKTEELPEMDLLGKIYKEISLEGGYHHDYFLMPNGNLLVASDNFSSGYGTVEDVVVEVDINTGDIVKTFDLKDILNMEDGKSENWTSYDWFHNNSVWYDENTNSITLSGRHQDAVINIDYDTGNLNWIIGDPTNWSEEYQKYFFTPIGDDFEWQWSQHAAMITPEGYVFLLDNGNNKSKIKEEYVPATESYTRGVMYKIDTDNMTIEQVWEYGKERGSEFYSPYISDVDYLAKDHYIVHSGGIVYVDGKNSNEPAGIGGSDKLESITVELKNDKEIFELVLPTNNYRVEKMSLYADYEHYEKGTAVRIGSLGKTSVSEEKLGFVLGTKDIQEFDREFEVTKEIDRLVVSGRFKRGEDVRIILYQNMNSKVYRVPVSKKPYTALCLDIFTEDETENGIVVYKYINEEGLKGKYSIYLQIDDVIYDTNQYVEF